MRLLSTTIDINKNILQIDKIEDFLKDKYGEIIRWAIVYSNEDIFKISLTYKDCN